MPSESMGAAPRFSIVLPTRNRLRLLSRFLDGLVAQTTDIAQVEVVLAIDDDDLASQAFQDARVTLKKAILPAGSTMGRLSQAAFEVSTGRYIVGLNDDVMIRTRGWDELVAATIGRHDDDIALLYGDDMLFSERLATFPIVSRRASLAIGLCPDIYRRYRIDDHIFEVYHLLALLGHPRIYYLPEVVFEHDNYATADDGTGTHNKRVYVADERVLAADALTFDALIEDRKAAALRLAGLIEDSARERRTIAARTRLARVADSFSYRRPEVVSVVGGQSTAAHRMRPTVVIVSADLRTAHARRCLASVKAHTSNCDLLVLDNGRSPSFNHAREMNRAIDATPSDLMVFLDDDVVVEAGWLEGLVAALDERIAVVTPIHRNGRGRRSYSGGYLKGDGRGTHSQTLDLPRKVRGTELGCSAAILIDRRKLPGIKFDDEYGKYFFDVAFSLKVWESGYRVVCTPKVIVTHLGGATMPQGTTTVSQAAWERDRRIFVKEWIVTGRLDALRSLGWQQDGYVRAVSDAPRHIDELLEQHRGDGLTVVLAVLAKAWRRYRAYPLLREQLLDRVRIWVDLYAASLEIHGSILRWVARHRPPVSAKAKGQSRDRIRRLKQRVKRDWRVAVFGVFPFGAECFLACEAASASVVLFLDNDPERQRSIFLGRPVATPERLVDWLGQVDAVVLTSRLHSAAMRSQLTGTTDVTVPIIDYFEDIKVGQHIERAQRPPARLSA